MHASSKPTLMSPSTFPSSSSSSSSSSSCPVRPGKPDSENFFVHCCLVEPKPLASGYWRFSTCVSFLSPSVIKTRATFGSGGDFAMFSFYGPFAALPLLSAHARRCITSFTGLAAKQVSWGHFPVEPAALVQHREAQWRHIPFRISTLRVRGPLSRLPSLFWHTPVLFGLGSMFDYWSIGYTSFIKIYMIRSLRMITRRIIDS